MVSCTEGILGIRPDLFDLRLSPAIPDVWDKLEIDKMFRNKKLHITITRNGNPKLILNGEELKDNYIEANKLKEINNIELYL